MPKILKKFSPSKISLSGKGPFSAPIIIKFVYFATVVFVVAMLCLYEPELVKIYWHDSTKAFLPVIGVFISLVFFSKVIPSFLNKIIKHLSKKGLLNKLLVLIRKRWDLFVVTGIIGVCSAAYFVISVGQYYRFEADAWDLGIYSQVEYHLSRGEAPAVSFKAPFREGGSDISAGATRNFILQDHFEPILVLFAPIYRLWPNGGCLMFLQLIFVCVIGGFGIYFLAKKVLKNPAAAILVTFGFYFFTGVQQGLVSDFHSNTLAVGLFPWVILLLEKNRLKKAFFLAISIFLFNEVASIFVFAIGFFALFRKKFVWGIIVMLLSLTWFMGVTKWLIPTFGGRPYAYSSEYPFREIIKGNASLPKFTQTLLEPTVKSATISQHLFSSAFLIVFSPAIFLLAPSFMRAFLHPSYFVAWGISRHYWIESFMFAAIALIYGIRFLSLKSKWLALFLALMFVGQSYIHGMSRNTAWYGNKPLPYYFEYLERMRINIPHEVLNNVINKYIPSNAKVAAQNTILPHLANRQTVYLLPQVFDAEYVIFNTKDIDFAPLDEEMRAKMIADFKSSPEWVDLFDFEGVRLFRRK
jgi:uncharacterized membrane protein